MASPIPSGYVRLSELIEKTTAAIYGDWSIAPFDAPPETAPGEEYLDPVDGSLHRNAIITVFRGGQKLSNVADAAIASDAREHLRGPLQDGLIKAFVRVPGGEILELPAGDYWGTDKGGESLESGVYISTDGEVAGREIIIPDAGAKTFLDWLNTHWLPLFDEKMWSMEQALAWVYTRNPDAVRASSPYVEWFRSIQPKRMDGEALVASAAYDEWPCPLRYDVAERELFKAIRDGVLQVTGKENGAGTPKPVPVEFFASRDISLYFEASGSGATHGKIQHPSQPFWSDLFFPSMDVRNKWGAILPPSSLTPQSVDAAPVLPVPNNEQPKYAPRRERSRKNRSYDWPFIFNEFDKLVEWHGGRPGPDGGKGWERWADAWRTIQDEYHEHFKATPPDVDHIAKRVRAARKDYFSALKKQEKQTET